MHKWVCVWVVLILSSLCACSLSSQAAVATHTPDVPPLVATLTPSPSTATFPRLPSPQGIDLTPTLLPSCTRCSLSSGTALAPTDTASPTPQTRPATVKVEKLDVWDDPAQEKSYWHLQTQLITGERVLVLAERGEWAQIVAIEQPSSKDERGYPGWVRSTGLVPGWIQAEEYLVVLSRTAQARLQPDPDSRPLMRLYFDTRLPVISKAGTWIQARLPDGRLAWLELGNLRLAVDPSQPVSTTTLLDRARSLEKAPYIWGGTTTDSPDCSGFVYRLFHAFGISLARDADDQAAGYGKPVTLQDIKPADLLFYSDQLNGPVTHVGLSLGNNQIMDADPQLGLSIHSLDDMQKYYFLTSIRRID